MVKYIFMEQKKGHKIDSIEKCDKVSYCVMDKGIKNDDGWSYTFKSVIVFGRIRILTDDGEKIEKLTQLGDKFFPTHEETVKEINRLLNKTAVFEITPEHITGKIVEEK